LVGTPHLHLLLMTHAKHKKLLPHPSAFSSGRVG
jgi:hypothetical protein